MRKYLIFIFVLIASQSINAIESDPRQKVRDNCLQESLDHESELQQLLEDWLISSGRASVPEYQQTIGEIESSEGVFSDVLLPELLGIGSAYIEEGNSADASSALKRALHIIRVNEGLYSIKQIPVLQLLIESNSLNEDWVEVSNNYDHMYWLYRRNFNETDPGQLKALQKIRNWYIESFNRDTDRSLEQIFNATDSIYERSLQIVRQCTSSERGLMFLA